MPFLPETSYFLFLQRPRKFHVLPSVYLQANATKINRNVYLFSLGTWNEIMSVWPKLISSMRFFIGISTVLPVCLHWLQNNRYAYELNVSFFLIDWVDTMDINISIRTVAVNVFFFWLFRMKWVLWNDYKEPVSWLRFAHRCFICLTIWVVWNVFVENGIDAWSRANIRFRHAEFKQ